MTSAIVALLAEDEVLLRMMVEDVLLSEKIEFVSVGTGDAAILKLRENAARFQVIISDIRMPGSIDGWDVGRAARQFSPDAAVSAVGSKRRPKQYSAGKALHRQAACRGDQKLRPLIRP